jgi:hypothetical protein
MTGCVGALHGLLVRLKAPLPVEESSDNVSAYYSGHYCWNGIHLQAICNSNYCFLYFAVAALEKTNNIKAIKKTTLLDWIEKLPPGYFVACDCAYSISEPLIGPYSGVEYFL